LWIIVMPMIMSVSSQWRDSNLADEVSAGGGGVNTELGFDRGFDRAFPQLTERPKRWLPVPMATEKRAGAA
ncbi:MAG: hypothetical protein L6Q95_15730, partial [Planctomycetes bacterium]|nr:hypothetical protein [Planctomycetota bacterium]